MRLRRKLYIALITPIAMLALAFVGRVNQVQGPYGKLLSFVVTDAHASNTGVCFTECETLTNCVSINDSESYCDWSYMGCETRTDGQCS